MGSSVCVCPAPVASVAGVVYVLVSAARRLAALPALVRPSSLRGAPDSRAAAASDLGFAGWGLTADTSPNKAFLRKVLAGMPRDAAAVCNASYSGRERAMLTRLLRA